MDDDIDLQVETLTTDQLRRRLDAVTVVEALSPPYYADGHVPGAVNIPADRVASLAPRRIPSTANPVVVYCAHRGCGNAAVVIRALRTLGYRDVAMYADGKRGWVEAGLPLERSGATGEDRPHDSGLTGS